MDTKNSILDVAVKLFAQDGFDQVSVEEIASVLEIAKGTMYYHFASKDEIVIALIDREMKIFNKIVADAAESETEPERKLAKVVETQLDYCLKHRDFCRFLFSELWRLQRRWNYNIANLQSEYVKIVSDILEEGIDRNVFRSDIDLEITSMTLFSGLAVASLDINAFYKNVNPDTQKEKLHDLFLGGILINR